MFGSKRGQRTAGVGG